MPFINRNLDNNLNLRARASLRVNPNLNLLIATPPLLIPIAVMMLISSNK